MSVSVITLGTSLITTTIAATSTSPSATSSTPTSTSRSTTSTTPTSTSSSSSSSSSSTTSSSSSTPSSTSSSTTSSTSSTPTSTTVATTTTSTSSGSTGPVVVTKTLTYTTSATVSTTTSATSTPTHGSSSGFFANTGAVAGVFTVVGLIGLAFLVLVILTIIRRRKAAQLDKEIAAAAAGGEFNNAAFEDEYDNQGSSSHYPTSTGTHGAYGQAPVGQGGQWDPYNQASYDAGIAAAPGAFAMRDRRTSTGTGTSAGMAGFGARGAAAAVGAGPGYPPYSDGSTTQRDPSSVTHEQSPYAAYASGPRSAEHEGGGGYGGYNDPTGYGAHPGPAHPGEYYDPYTNTAVPASPPAAGMPVPQHQPSYGHANEEAYNDDAYGGVEEYDDHEPQQPGQPPYLQGAHRQDSSGTYRDDEDLPPRTLKVANE